MTTLYIANVGIVLGFVCVFLPWANANSDERWLISFGRRGGWRKEWNFGTGRN